MSHQPNWTEPNQPFTGTWMHRELQTLNELAFTMVDHAIFKTPGRCRHSFLLSSVWWGEIASLIDCWNCLNRFWRHDRHKIFERFKMKANRMERERWKRYAAEIVLCRSFASFSFVGDLKTCMQLMVRENREWNDRHNGKFSTVENGIIEELKHFKHLICNLKLAICW